MGDIKVFTDARLNESADTVTSYNGSVARVSTFLDSLQDLTNSVQANTQAVQNMTSGSTPEMDSFKEVSDNINIEDFIAGLEG